MVFPFPATPSTNASTPALFSIFPLFVNVPLDTAPIKIVEPLSAEDALLLL